MLGWNKPSGNNVKHPIQRHTLEAFLVFEQGGTQLFNFVRVVQRRVPEWMGPEELIFGAKVRFKEQNFNFPSSLRACELKLKRKKNVSN